MEKITIITVTYNCEKVIEETILNVLSQDYTNIEYIIVDGASKDKTLDIINKYSDKIDKIVSEPDSGVYFAMNKAVRLATGKWINFMNAGDTFFDEHVVSNLFNNSNNEADVIFGNTLSICNGEERFLSYRPNWWKHKLMPACHQSIFVRTEVLLKYRFNTDYKISADVDSFKRMKKDGITFYYVPIIVARYDASDGISQNSIRYYRELYSIKFSNPIIKNVFLLGRIARIKTSKIVRKIKSMIF